MTDAICYRDAYARRTEARVTAVERTGDAVLVRLDRTVFYPGGGGQPPDAGWLESIADGATRWCVTGARRSGGDVVHALGADEASEAPGEGAGQRLPEEGEQVAGAIDWDRRYLLMRTHTALHALCGVVWRDHGALVTGGNMEPGSGRMDFEFERMSGELVGTIEARVNEELAKEREVRIRSLPREEAFSIPDLVRTKVNLLPEGITEVRVVEIVGLDLQADGGTHVANTREVGRITVTGYESKGRVNKRIRIALED